MSTDTSGKTPVSFDFFQRITNVNFGSMWLGIETNTIYPDPFPPINQTAKWDISFPGQAGGTPGYPVIAPPLVINPRFKHSPYTIKAADLTADFPTGAGADFEGFAVGNNTSTIPHFLTANTGVYINCGANGHLKTAFRVRLSGTDAVGASQVAGFISLFEHSVIAKNTIGVSNLVPQAGDAVAQVSFIAFVRTDFPGQPTFPLDFLVDPVKKTVTPG